MAEEEINVRVVLRGWREFNKNSRSTARQVERMGDEIEHVGDESEITTTKVGRLKRGLLSLSASNRKTEKEFFGVASAIGRANQQASFFRNTLRLLTVPTSLAFLGALAQALSVAAAGATALGAALAPLGGYLAAIPVLASAAIQGVGLTNFAFANLKEALGGNKKALDKLTPAGLELFDVLTQLKPTVEGLRSEVQRGLFPGVVEGLNQAKKSLGVLKPIFFGTGQAVGGLIARLGELIGGSWQADIAKQGQRNIVTISRLGRAGLNFANALRHIMMAAKPLIDFLSIGILKFARWTSKTAAAGRQSGKLQEFFRSTVAVTKQLISIIVDLGGFMRNVFKAAAPLGRAILDVFQRGSDSLRAWSDSAKGKNALDKYFERAKKPLWEMGRLARDFIKLFFKLSAQPGLANMIKLIRTDMLPALEEASANFSVAFGPAVVKGLANFVRLIGQLSGHAGPLTVFVTIIGTLMGWLADLLDASPFLGNILVGFAAVAAVSKTVSFVGTITGIGKLVGKLKLWDRMLKLLRGSTIALRAQLVLLRIQTMLMAFWGKIVAAATKVWAAMQWLLNTAMLANPVVLIIVAIVAVVAAIIIAYHKFEWFRNLLNSIWTWIKGHWPLLLVILSGPIGLAVVLIVKNFGKIKSVISSVLGWVRSHWPLILAIMTGPIGLAVLLIVNNFGRIKSAASSVWNFIKNGWNGMISFFSSLPGKIANAAKGMFHGIKDAFKSAINWIIAGWNHLRFGVPKIKIPGPIPDVPGFSVGTPDIPYLAAGGQIIKSGVSIVGEEGPELLNLPSGAVVQPIGPSNSYPSPPNPSLMDAGNIEPFAGLTAVAKIFLNQRQIGEAVAEDWEDRRARR